ncbi:MAG: ABC transporter ATP-binding protein [Treponema sp.]|nr:ABC transporter ATP-binding protein [Treponema sp.]
MTDNKLDDTTILLEVKDLTVCVKKEGKTLKILDNISFSINEGEIIGLAGESGCGKSMTALSILNLLPLGISITGGEIIYKNCNLTALSEKEMPAYRGKEISIIFQDVRNALNPLMKAGKQIMESLELDKEKSIDKKQKKKKVLEILSALGFNNPEKIFETYPHQLSGGMCQRIMTAMSVIQEPKLLLADEPSSSLDEESQNLCLSLLKEMNQKNKMSLLVISHDLSIIQQYCSRYLIMYAGKIVEEGKAQDLLTPLHPYTQALVNTIPNKDKRGKKLENIPGKVPSIDDQLKDDQLKDDQSKDNNLKGCPFAPRCSKAQNKCFETFPPARIICDRKVHCYNQNEANHVTN